MGEREKRERGRELEGASTTSCHDFHVVGFLVFRLAFSTMCSFCGYMAKSEEGGRGDVGKEFRVPPAPPFVYCTIVADMFMFLSTMRPQ